MNIPYDKPFAPLYIAYVTGLIELGLKPVATLAIPGGEARLDRIFELIRSSHYSIHDLSRVQIDRQPPATPRFNMPFELGMAVAWSKSQSRAHTYFAFEQVNRRSQKSLSDMAGSDFYIHDGTPTGIMRELCSAFIRQTERPSVPAMMHNYHIVRSELTKIMRRSAAKSIFEARAFEDLVTVATEVRRRFARH